MTGLELVPIVCVGALRLVVIGLFGMVISPNLIRIILSLAVLEGGSNLFMIMVGYQPDAVAPIIVNGVIPAAMVDPVPQALVLTAIVIGVGVQAFAITLAMRLRRAYGTQDVREIRRRMEQDIGGEAGIAAPGSQDQPGFPHPRNAAVGAGRG